MSKDRPQIASELIAPSLPEPRPWSEVPLIEMVPLQYRAAVAEIVERNPNARHILEQCKWGVMDCWQAMEKLGVPDFQHQEHEADHEITCLYCAKFGTCKDAESLDGSCERFEQLHLKHDGEIRNVPAEPLSFSCWDCKSFYKGWCRAIPGKTLYTIEFLGACPLENCQ